MTMRAWSGCMMVVFAVAATACGDDGSGSGVPGNKPLSEVTDEELGQLCDWTNEQQGGYGRTIACTEGTDVVTNTSREQCIMQDGPVLTQCGATVAEYEACTLELAKDPCALAQALASEPCAAVRSCLL